MERNYTPVGVSIRKDILAKIDEKCGEMIPRSRIINKALEKEFGARP